VTTTVVNEHVILFTYSLEQGILANISCHVMKYFLYIHFPHDKFYVTWKNIPCHAMEYFVTSCAWSFGINNGLLTLNMGLANKAIKCSIMWRFEGKKQNAFHHPYYKFNTPNYYLRVNWILVYNYHIMIHNIFCETLMFINLYRHGISIFSLNCNKNSLNIKLHVNYICGNEFLCMMQKHLCV